MLQLSFAPSGLGAGPVSYPRLAPWAAFFRRFAAWLRVLHSVKRNPRYDSDSDTSIESLTAF